MASYVRAIPIARIQDVMAEEMRWITGFTAVYTSCIELSGDPRGSFINCCDFVMRYHLVW